ncbi:MAG: hypothetical protein MMC23_003760 [Stictis urceolatum]|nr:hypothetical protein [Stictis urceolata]
MSPALLSRLPLWASRWLGYRATPPPKLPPYLIWIWAFIGAFAGLSVLQSIFTYSSYFTSRHVPGLIASYGASAVLVYHTLDSPLAQPRALLGGHFISALTGVCITKLFGLLPSQARFESVKWLAASLSSATAIVLMAVTETTHPPAGATALLPAVDEGVRELGWYLLPVVLLSSSMILATGLVVNNLQRRWPVFWWKPGTPGEGAGKPAGSKEGKEGNEGQAEGSDVDLEKR